MRKNQILIVAGALAAVSPALAQEAPDAADRLISRLGLMFAALTFSRMEFRFSQA